MVEKRIRLAYVPVDVQERWDRDYTGSSDLTRYIKCPTCMSETVVR